MKNLRPRGKRHHIQDTMVGRAESRPEAGSVGLTPGYPTVSAIAKSWEAY